MSVSNSTKIFIAVLFLIGILFIVGINIGAAHSNDQTFSTPGWLTGLGATLAHPQPLKLSDLSPISASCLQQGRFAVPTGNTCLFAIQQSSFALRVVTLQLVQGTSAIMTLSQEQALPVQQSLMGTGTTTNADLKVYPGKAHGMLAIKCLNAGGAHACLLQLK
jgi:hypothetical protein